MKNKNLDVSLFWCFSIFVCALFFGSLAGTVTKILWDHWKGWLLGVFVLGAWALMLFAGLLLDIIEDIKNGDN